MSTSLHGKSFIAGVLVDQSARPFQAISPLDNHPLEPEFHECTLDAVEEALTCAEEAFPVYRRLPAEAHATFLEKIFRGDRRARRFAARAGAHLEEMACHSTGSTAGERWAHDESMCGCPRQSGSGKAPGATRASTMRCPIASRSPAPISGGCSSQSGR